jgi:hypothetical protein
MAAHVAAQAGMLGEGTGLGRRSHDQSVGCGLTGDDAPDIGGLIADRIARVGFRLDPIDEGDKPAMRAAARGQGTTA